MFCLLSIGCFHVELKHTGLIKDADTQKPLKDVIVFLELECSCFLPPNPGGGNEHDIGYKEVLTDTEGRYNLSPSLYLMPPLLCWTEEPALYFFKAGYFKYIKTIKKPDNDITLYEMNYFLNYLPYIRDSYVYYDSFGDNSKLLKAELTKIKKLPLKPADEIGVFFRSPNRRFTRIISYFEMDLYDPLSTNTFIFAYDETAKEWLCLDSRGTMIDLTNNSLKDGKEWFFLDSRGKITDLTNNSLKDGRIIPALPLPGTYRNYIEIENGGNSLCKNNSNERVSRQLDPSLINPPLSCFTGKDLPLTKEDDSVKNSKFIFSAQSRGNGHFVGTRTQKFWHIYRFQEGYDSVTKTVKMNIEHLISFPLEKKIVGLAASDNDFFLAFNNEGIRKYKYIYGYGIYDTRFKEDETFFINSSRIGKLNINSISYGSTVNMRAIYATAGDDKIYRFSEADGTPDYIIKPISD